MTIKLKGLPAFRQHPVRDIFDIMTSINNLNAFSRKITEKNMRDGINEFRSEYEYQKE